MKDTAQLRVENKKKIRTVMREGKEFTKQELARYTGLSTATCNTLINEMAADGEVTGHKLQLGEVGRSSLAYQLNDKGGSEIQRVPDHRGPGPLFHPG